MGFLTYDELYGIDINDYCLAHNTTIDEIISKSRIDIKLLKNNLKRLLNRAKGDDSVEAAAMITPVHSAIQKKQNHINKMEDWQAGI